MGRFINMVRRVYAKILWSGWRQRIAWELREWGDVLGGTVKRRILRLRGEYVLPKTIFTYWDTDVLSPVIKANIETWRRKLPEWQLVVLQGGNLADYVPQSFIDEYKDKVDPVRFSELLRLELLYRYGGVWMDGGIFVIDPRFINRMHEECLQQQYDACLYELKERTRHPEYPFLDSWFIMANRGSPLIHDWNREFVRSYRVGFMPYKRNVLIKNGMDVANTIGHYDQDVYLMMHATLNYLFFMKKQYKVKRYDARESMYKIYYACGFDAKQIAQAVMDKAESGDWGDMYAVKLRGADRQAIQTIPGAMDKYVALLSRV